MNTADKVHKTLRLRRELADSIKALSIEGESETATYCRVLSAGVDALRGGERHDGGGETEQQPMNATQEAALVSSLQEHIETLKRTVDELSGQMAIKDKQIEALSVLTAQAQQATTKALDTPQATQSGEDGGQAVTTEPRRGFWARLFG